MVGEVHVMVFKATADGRHATGVILSHRKRKKKNTTNPPRVRLNQRVHLWWWKVDFEGQW